MGTIGAARARRLSLRIEIRRKDLNRLNTAVRFFSRRERSRRQALSRGRARLIAGTLTAAGLGSTRAEKVTPAADLLTGHGPAMLFFQSFRAGSITAMGGLCTRLFADTSPGEFGGTLRGHGCNGGQIFRTGDGLNEMVALFDWDDLDRVRLFAQSEILREPMLLPRVNNESEPLAFGERRPGIHLSRQEHRMVIPRLRPRLASG